MSRVRAIADITCWNRWGFLALLCALVASWTVLTGLRVLWLTNHTHQWQEAEAWIESVSIKDSLGRYSVSRSIKCRYRYNHAGREYFGKTIALLLGDNAWKEEWYVRLRAKQDREEPIACFVDPTKPARAVLTRDLSDFRLINDLLIFLLCSGYLVGWGIHVRRSKKRERTHGTD